MNEEKKKRESEREYKSIMRYTIMAPIETMVSAGAGVTNKTCKTFPLEQRRVEYVPIIIIK